jgi:hypothetical protein
MPNSPQIPFLAHNSTVKAWCWTGTTTTGSATSPSQVTVDAVSFIDGYNLRLDSVSHTNVTAAAYPTGDVYNGSASGPYAALRFSFITPMPDTKYKVFVQFSMAGAANQYIPYAHTLNSATYPKTTTGFWVRAGTPILSAGPTRNQMIAVTLFPWSNMRVIVL